jgi:hypothetical protein
VHRTLAALLIQHLALPSTSRVFAERQKANSLKYRDLLGSFGSRMPQRHLVLTRIGRADDLEKAYHEMRIDSMDLRVEYMPWRVARGL